MRSGKDTVQQVLTKAIIYQVTSRYSKYLAYPLVTKLAFGDAVKSYSKELFPDFYEDNNIKQRKLLQDFGQGMRKIDPDIWVKTLDRELNKTIATPTLFENIFIDTELETFLLTFITDVRQPNEFDYVKDKGLTIKVEATDEVRRSRMKSKGEDTSEELMEHETESHIDGFETDFVIDNNGDEMELRKQLEPIIQHILEEVVTQVE